MAKIISNNGKRELTVQEQDYILMVLLKRKSQILAVQSDIKELNVALGILEKR